MSDDEYRAVLAEHHTLLAYPCGVRAGDRLRQTRDLSIIDHEGTPTGSTISAGSIWLVLAGLPHEPEIIWLEEPNGRSHTWDASALDAFELLDRTG
jgi:hypothetical protein